VSQENVDRYALAARVHALLEPELAAEGWDLVDVRVFQGGGRLQLRLYVDLPGDERIDLDGCAAASRAASMFLEEADPFAGAWVLEVSSPGIRRPLRTEAHFQAAMGVAVAVKWRNRGVAQNLRGRVVTVQDGVVTLAPLESRDESEGAEPTMVPVPVADILEANLENDFDVQAVIREERRQRKQERRDQRAQRRPKKSRPKKRDDDPPTAPAADVPDTDERDG